MKFVDGTVRRYQSKDHQAVMGGKLHDLRGKSNRSGIKFYSPYYNSWAWGLLPLFCVLLGLY